MKMQGLMSAAVACSLIAFAGCTNESPPGGPGAVKKPTPNGDTATTAANPDQTFTLKVPATEMNIDQGKEEEMVLTIDRGKDFKQGVKLTFSAPAGVTLTPATGEIPASSTELKVMVAAASTAAVGKGKITVTATPDTGKAVVSEVPVEVKEVKAGT